VGLRVSKPEDFQKIVKQALEMKKPVLIDVATDPKRF
jgi:thiamine pyrophosphate-dependent acetolactate synthase large subunit-like protein